MLPTAIVADFHGFVSVPRSQHCLELTFFALSSPTRTSHVLFSYIYPTDPAGLEKLKAALNQFISDGKSFRFDSVSTKFADLYDDDLYITGKTPQQLEENLVSLQAAAGEPISSSERSPIYMETIMEPILDPVMAKSPNKHLRIYVTAKPIRDDLVGCIEGPMGVSEDIMRDETKRADFIRAQLAESAECASRILATGPNNCGLNFLVNPNRDPLEGRETSLSSAFQWAMAAGPLMEQPVRGCRIDIKDFVEAADSSDRKVAGGQVLPTMRRAISGAILKASPAVCEPIYRLKIEGSDENALKAASDVLSAAGGFLVSESVAESATSLGWHLSAREALTIETRIREATDGKVALADIGRPRYAVIPSSPFDQTSLAGSIVAKMRRVKGIRPMIPDAEAYLDKP